MAKTRRKKINGKAPLASGNITLVEIGRDMTSPKRGDPILITKLTGVNKGRIYPYASTRCGGKPREDLRIAPGRHVVSVIEGDQPVSK